LSSVVDGASLTVEDVVEVSRSLKRVEVARSSLRKATSSREVVEKADVLVLDERSHRFLGYHFGVNVVDVVVKDGEVISQRSLHSGDS
jgi:hypothetical protein